MEELLDRYSRSSERSIKGSNRALAHRDSSLELLSDWRPTVDVEEKKEEYLIKAELPGVKKEDVTVSIENGLLTVKGEKKFEKEEKDKKHHLVECSYGSFMRSFTLPTGAKAEMVNAEFKDGVLKLTVPKTEEEKTKQIDIKIK
jgi:HSP20 family protein